MPPLDVRLEGRDDVTVVPAPSKSVGFITGARGESLRQIEASSGTFCFTDGSTLDSEKETENRQRFNDVPGDMPLLWAIREGAGLTGTKPPSV